MPKPFLSTLQLPSLGTAPSTGSAGELFWDSTNRRLLAYDGVSWVSIGPDSVARVDFSLLGKVPIFAQPTGSYVIPFAVNGTALTTLALTANQIRAVPFVVSRAVRITTIAINVSTAATGTTVTVGIYASTSSTGLPSSRLYLSPGLDSATTGTKTATLTLDLSPGIYWIAVWSAGAPTLRAVPAGALAPLAGHNIGSNNAANNQLTLTTTSGLTDPFPSGAAWAAGSMPAVGVLYTIL